MNDELLATLSLSNITKGGTISPTDVALNGTLTPAQGRALISAIVDNSGVLKRIVVDVTGKLTKKRTALDAAKGVLVRHISGVATPDTAKAKLGVVGAELDMTKYVVLEAQINKDTLDDNQDNPNFETEQYNGFSMVFSNDLTYLGFVGTADNAAADAPFNQLAKGWLTIAAESDNTAKATYTIVADDAGATVVAALRKVRETAHSDIRQTMSIFISPEDYESYTDYIESKHQNTTALTASGLYGFKGNELIIVPDMPQGTYLGTPLQNMVMGISKNIQRDRWWDPDRSAMRYRFIVNPDYEFDVHKYVTLVTEAPAA